MTAKKTTVLDTKPRRRPKGLSHVTRVAQHDVAHRAYELFLARGGAHGRHVEDWLRAELELQREREA
jgi:hypothetical protein